jgi:glycosyltransferase involved in cell wall biosynthesis
VGGCHKDFEGMTSSKINDDLISIYLPTRNRAALLPRAIESVLSQTHRNLELIISDDGSTDLTQQVVSRYAQDDSRVLLISSTSRLGAPAARNRAISVARGRWITGIDDDDWMLPDRLEQLLNGFDNRYSLICTGQILDFGCWSRAVRTSARYVTLEDELYRDEVGTQMMTMTSRLREIGGFDEQLPAWQDYDLWVRLIERFGIAKRLARPTYVQSMSDDPYRISASGAAGADRFFEKHHIKMSRGQKARQSLERIMLRKARLDFASLRRMWVPKARTTALRYFITSNVPFLRVIANFLRKTLRRLYARQH